MTAEEIQQNRNAFIEELRATGRQGLESLVSLLDSTGFFSARLDDTDPGDGSLANHCLWVLRLARDLNAYYLENRADKAVGDESLVIVCLLHHSRGLLLKSGFRTEKAEMECSPAMEDLLAGAEKNARDYASGIPYGAEASEHGLPQAEYAQSDLYLDQEDHRLWWNVTAGGESAEHPDFEGYVPTPASRMFNLAIGAGGTAEDMSVFCDQNGVMACLCLFSIDEDGSLLLQSDRQCFNFADMTFYLSRYPQYRPSFVAAKRLDGKWGVFSLRRSGKKRLPLVEVTPVVRYEFRNRDAAVRAIKSRTGFPMRVSHHLFYTEFTVTDCLGQQTILP